MQKITYAQNGEDILLWRALSQIQNGFYVDVGAAWPDEDSVTKLFYDHGWCGINIEPNPVLYEKLSKDRLRDLSLQIAISDEEGEAEMFFFGDTGLSTLEKGNLFNGIRQGYQPVAAMVRVSTLSSVLEQHVKGRQIHFMKVDVEGLEARVLRGSDWKRFRPWIVIVEATLPSSQVLAYGDWEPFLLAENYEFVWADGLNRFYVAREHVELKNSFQYPPNIFDGFSTRKEVESLELIQKESAKAAQMQSERDHWWAVADQAVRERESLKDAAAELARIREVNLKLEYEVARTHALHDGVAAAATTLGGRATELTRENSAQMGEIITLRERLAFSMAHVEALQNQVSALQGAVQAEHNSLNSQLYPLRHELLEVRNQLESSLVRQQETENQRLAIKGALRDEQDRNAKLKTELEAKEIELVHWRGVNQQLEVDKEALERDLTTKIHHWWSVADTLNQELETYRTSSQSEVHHWWSVADGLAQELEALRAQSVMEVHKWWTVADGLARDLDTLKTQSAIEVHKWWSTADGLIRQESAMRRSLSWRLTMPLRGIRHPVRSFKRLVKALLFPFTALKGTTLGRKLGKRFPGVAKALVRTIAQPPVVTSPSQSMTVVDPSPTHTVVDQKSRGDFTVGRLSERSLQILAQLRRTEGNGGTHS